MAQFDMALRCSTLLAKTNKFPVSMKRFAKLGISGSKDDKRIVQYRPVPADSARVTLFTSG